MTDVADFGLIYDQKKRLAGQQRDATMAANKYSRGLAQQRGQRDVFDLNQNRTQGLEGLASGYAHRGLGNSGLWQQGQNQYASDWGSEQNTLMNALTDKLNSFDLSDANAVAGYDSTAADLDAQKTRDILSTASAIRGYRTIGGNSG